MPGDDLFELYIDTLTPATISMGRLAEYMAQLAELLGHKEHVHFEALRGGSLTVSSRVEPVAQHKVRRRLDEVRYGDRRDQRAATSAYHSLDRLLAEDNAVGKILHRSSSLIEFPGRTRLLERTVGPVEQAGSLDGEVIQIGGRHETINVVLRTRDDLVPCTTTKDVARRLAHHLFGRPVRLAGVGKWSRSESGKWTLRGKFTIHSFEPLDSTPLPKLFGQLRNKLAGGPESHGDPIEFLSELRRD